MNILHLQPKELGKREKVETRVSEIAKGVTYQLSDTQYLFQTRPEDLSLINGRASKLNALVSLGMASLDDTTIVGTDGATSPLTWRSEDNMDIAFTVREFLEFAIYVDEFVESKYKESWI